MTTRGAVSETLRDRIGAFLDAHTVLVLATADEGGPWAAPLCYARDAGLRLYFLSDPSTRHCRALLRRAEVAGSVQEEASNWEEFAGLQFSGTASPLAEPEAGEVFSLYAAKFPFAASLIPHAGPHRFFRITPRWLRLISNRCGLGVKEELHLSEGERMTVRGYD